MPLGFFILAAIELFDFGQPGFGGFYGAGQAGVRLLGLLAIKAFILRTQPSLGIYIQGHGYLVGVPVDQLHRPALGGRER